MLVLRLVRPFPPVVLRNTVCYNKNEQRFASFEFLWRWRCISAPPSWDISERVGCESRMSPAGKKMVAPCKETLRIVHGNDVANHDEYRPSVNKRRFMQE